MKTKHYLIPTLSFFMLLSICSSTSNAQDSLIEQLSNKHSNDIRINTILNILDMGPNAVTLLLNGVKNPNQSIKIESIRLLGEIQAKNAVDDLLSILFGSDESIYTKSMIINTLGLIGDKQATPAIIEISTSDQYNYTLRVSAIISLGLLRDNSAIPALKNILRSEDKLLQIYAAGSLGKLGVNEGWEEAVDALDSDDFSIRLLAIKAIGLIGDDKSERKLSRKRVDVLSYSEQQAFNITEFQLQINKLGDSEKINFLKSLIMKESKISEIAEWAIIELSRIEDKKTIIALEEIENNHSNDLVVLMVKAKRKAILISNIIEEEVGYVQ